MLHTRITVAMTTALAGVLALATYNPATGQQLYKVIDEHGKVTYTDVKPEPDNAVIEERVTIPVAEDDQKPTLEELAARKPIVLYTVPECSACDMVRTYLESKKYPYTEINVEGDVEAQKQMKTAVGNLSVPTLTVDGRKLTGFNASALDAILDIAGYPANTDDAGQDTTTQAEAGQEAPAPVEEELLDDEIPDTDPEQDQFLEDVAEEGPEDQEQ